MRNRVKGIPKGKNQVRVLGIPSIRDRVAQGALKLILEPVFETDFQPGSYGYRPKRTAHAAVNRVAKAVIKNKARVNLLIEYHGMQVNGTNYLIPVGTIIKDEADVEFESIMLIVY